jgi:hypothetical protein
MSTIDSIQQAQREITVDFPITKVKEAINLVFEKISSKYTKRADSVNDIMSTYHFPVQNKLNPAIIDMTLSELDNGKTKISISISNAGGSKSSNSILSGIMSDYLNILSKALVGDIETFDNIQKKSSDSGCVWIIVVIVVIIFVFFIMK